MHTAYLLTGSNIGDSEANLSHASLLIGQQIGEIVHFSSVYKTEPWGNKDQQFFLNQVLQVNTLLGPHRLMQTILQIEHEMGRNRQVKWEPRVIDIDILFYEGLVISEPDLKIPHPLLHERRFTLVPLHEIAPALIHPVLKKTVTQLLNDCPDSGVVEKL